MYGLSEGGCPSASSGSDEYASHNSTTVEAVKWYLHLLLSLWTKTLIRINRNGWWERTILRSCLYMPGICSFLVRGSFTVVIIITSRKWNYNTKHQHDKRTDKNSSHPQRLLFEEVKDTTMLRTPGLCAWREAFCYPQRQASFGYIGQYFLAPTPPGLKQRWGCAITTVAVSSW